MKKINLLFAGFAICLICVYGCRYSANQSDAKNMLAGKWLIQTLNGEDVVKEKAGATMPYLEFKLTDSIASGNTGCNDLGGKIVIVESEITFSAMSMSKIYCTDAKYEHDIVKFIFQSEPVKFKIKNNILTFSKYEKVIMTCKKSEY